MVGVKEIDDHMPFFTLVNPSLKKYISVALDLTSSNFDKLVVKSKDLWLVEFFAPWSV